MVMRHRGNVSKGIVRYVGLLPDKGDKVYVGIELLNEGNIIALNHSILSMFPCLPSSGNIVSETRFAFEEAKLFLKKFKSILVPQASYVEQADI